MILTASASLSSSRAYSSESSSPPFSPDWLMRSVSHPTNASGVGPISRMAFNAKSRIWRMSARHRSPSLMAANRARRRQRSCDSSFLNAASNPRFSQTELSSAKKPSMSATRLLSSSTTSSPTDISKNRVASAARARWTPPSRDIACKTVRNSLATSVANTFPDFCRTAGTPWLRRT